MISNTCYNIYGEPMRKIAIKLIEWYQRDISPNSNHKCRHNPTCSQYAKECYMRFNFFKASFLTTKRILTCNPLFKPKYDPVPEKKGKKKLQVIDHQHESGEIHEHPKT